MVVIRLSRRGNRKNTFYQIVVTDRRHPRDGRFIERVGYYSPISQGHNAPLLKVEKERVIYWLAQGAQATLRVQHLIKKLELAEEDKKDSSCNKDELKHRYSEHQFKKAP